MLSSRDSDTVSDVSAAALLPSTSSSLECSMCNSNFKYPREKSRAGQLSLKGILLTVFEVLYWSILSHSVSEGLWENAHLLFIVSLRIFLKRARFTRLPCKRSSKKMHARETWVFSLLMWQLGDWARWLSLVTWFSSVSQAAVIRKVGGAEELWWVISVVTRIFYS